MGGSSRRNRAAEALALVAHPRSRLARTFDRSEKETGRGILYTSALSASVGSTPSARLVGTMHASMHTPNMRAA